MIEKINGIDLLQADCLFIKKYKVQIHELLTSSLIINLYDIASANEYINERLKLMEKSILEDSAIIFYVEDENTLVGFIWAYLRNIISKEVHITDIVVNENYRNHHIATSLLNKLERFCYERNYNSITLIVSSDNLSALNLYEKNNFIEQRKFLRKVLSK